MRRLVAVLVVVFAGCGGSATISATATRPLLDSPVTMRFLEAMLAHDRQAWWVLPHPELRVRLTLRRGDETLASTTAADFTREIFEHRHGGAGDVRLDYPEAGHLVGGAVPYEPRGDHWELGGTPRADADAVADLFPRLVRFLGGS
jgi:hypothetical protein